MGVGRRVLMSTLAAVLIAGCGPRADDASDARLEKMSGKKKQKTVPVSGKVLVDGAPKGGVTVTLYPGKGGSALMQVQTNVEGIYCWTTYKNCDGLVPGDYKLGFALFPKQRRNDNNEAKDDVFKGKYSNPNTTEFKLTVADGPEQKDVNYELTTK